MEENNIQTQSNYKTVWIVVSLLVLLLIMALVWQWQANKQNVSENPLIQQPTLPLSYPPDFPIEESLKVLTASDIPGESVKAGHLEDLVKYYSDKGAQENYDQFLNYFSANGWTADVQKKDENPKILVARKEAQIIYVNIFEDAQKKVQVYLDVKSLE